MTSSSLPLLTSYHAGISSISSQSHFPSYPEKPEAHEGPLILLVNANSNCINNNNMNCRAIVVCRAAPVKGVGPHFRPFALLSAYLGMHVPPPLSSPCSAVGWYADRMLTLEHDFPFAELLHELIDHFEELEGHVVAIGPDGNSIHPGSQTGCTDRRPFPYHEVTPFSGVVFGDPRAYNSGVWTHDGATSTNQIPERPRMSAYCVWIILECSAVLAHVVTLREMAWLAPQLRVWHHSVGKVGCGEFGYSK
ncbi:hypothetical protein BS17DRAFT_808713 [Gyrodon lividus]|nr:hypothetical protein BS17DRAFT_808713 [Gyrodon lividus]